MERGEIVLVGATTESPLFHLSQVLRSRCQIFALTPINPEEIQVVLERTWSRERPNEPSVADVIDWLSHWAGGDLRAAILGLEVLMSLREKSTANLAIALGNHVIYDKISGHYDLANAFQKSLRGSDPNASLYYLSRMIQVGENADFIARRLLVCAAEDVGNADPQVFLLAEATSAELSNV